MSHWFFISERNQKKLPNDMVPKVGMNAPLTCVRIFNALNDEAENEKEAAYILYQNWSQPISNESYIMSHLLQNKLCDIAYVDTITVNTNCHSWFYVNIFLISYN